MARGEFGRGGAGVDAHAGGLVDDGEVVVLEDDVERDGFGGGVEGFGPGRAGEDDGLAGCELVLGLGGAAVDEHLAAVDEELHAGAGDLRDGLGEVLVEAEAARLGRRGDGMGGVLGAGSVGIEREGRDDEGGGRLDAAGGDVLGAHGAAALAFGEHVLGGHGQAPEEVVAFSGLGTAWRERRAGARASRPAATTMARASHWMGSRAAKGLGAG